MRIPLLFFCFAAAVGSVASCTAQWLPAFLQPQLGLVVVVAFAGRRGGASSLAAVWAAGLYYDQLSAAPPGYHTLLFASAWALTRLGVHQVELRSTGNFMCFALAVSATTSLLGTVVAGVPALAPESLGRLLRQAALDALCAPVIRHALTAWLGWLGGEEAQLLAPRRLVDEESL